MRMNRSDPSLPGLIRLLISEPEGFTETELQNLALSAGGDSLDQVELAMAYEEIVDTTAPEKLPFTLSGYYLPRQNFFLNRWIRHGGFWPDAKLRLFKRGYGRFEDRSVHETVKVDGHAATLSSVTPFSIIPTPPSPTTSTT